MAGETTDVNLVTTFFKKKYELKEDTREKQSTENRQPLPCAAGDALPYLPLVESVKWTPHVQASLCNIASPFCVACRL
ncbi:hypothetical protein ECPV144_35910 [Escherichia coli]